MVEGVVAAEDVADVVVEAEIAEANDGPVTLGRTAGAVGTDVEGKTTGIGTEPKAAEAALDGRGNEFGRADAVFAFDMPNKRLAEVADGRLEVDFLIVVADDKVVIVVVVLVAAATTLAVVVAMAAAETAPAPAVGTDAASDFGCSTTRFGSDFFFAKIRGGEDGSVFFESDLFDRSLERSPSSSSEKSDESSSEELSLINSN